MLRIYEDYSQDMVCIEEDESFEEKLGRVRKDDLGTASMAL